MAAVRKKNCTSFDDDVVVHVEELCRGGQNMPVTKSNYIKYINLMAHFKLNVHASVQCGAFLRGFRAIIPVKWIRLFSTVQRFP